MIVPIDDKTRIAGGGKAWEIQRPRKRKGKVCWEACQWYRTFGAALEAAVHREIRLHPAATLAEAIEAVASVVQRYEELIPSEYRLVK